MKIQAYHFQFQNTLEEKKMREREQKLDYIARMNEKHCSRVPVYGQDLCHTVDVFRDMNKTCVKDNTWKGLGMVYCHNVHNSSSNINPSSFHWKQTKVLSDLVNTPEQFLKKMEDIVLRYVQVHPIDVKVRRLIQFQLLDFHIIKIDLVEMVTFLNLKVALYAIKIYEQDFDVS